MDFGDITYFVKSHFIQTLHSSAHLNIAVKSFYKKKKCIRNFKKDITLHHWITHRRLLFILRDGGTTLCSSENDVFVADKLDTLFLVALYALGLCSTFAIDSVSSSGTSVKCLRGLHCWIINTNIVLFQKTVEEEHPKTYLEKKERRRCWAETWNSVIFHCRKRKTYQTLNVGSSFNAIHTPPPFLSTYFPLPNDSFCFSISIHINCCWREI